MCCKANLVGDSRSATLIMESRSPAEQQRLGRRVKGAMFGGWDSVKRSVVYKGNLEKFSQNKWAREQLFGTKGRILVEVSVQDRVRGGGVVMKDPARVVRGRWKDANWLGFVLTEVRERLLVECRYSSSLPREWKELCGKGRWGEGAGRR